MKHLLVLVVATVAQFCALPTNAQTDNYDVASNITPMQRDHIGIDGGLMFPFGDIGKGLDLSTAWGMNLNFWKFIDERFIGTITVGNSWYQLGSNVQSDSGIIDLSGYSMTATPLLGGIGYVFGTGDIHPYIVVHGGATFITVNVGKNRPTEEINNEAYFTLASTLGIGYGIAEGWTISTSARYAKMFGEDLQTIAILFGVSYRI